MKALLSFMSETLGEALIREPKLIAMMKIDKVQDDRIMLNNRKHSWMTNNLSFINLSVS